MRNNDFRDVVFNRHAIKVFDRAVKISHEEMLEMIEEATKAPSSVNMQPWRFVVVESEEGKDKLRPLIKFNTRQNDTSSAMILIFGDLNCYDRAEDILNKAKAQGFTTDEIIAYTLDEFKPAFEQAPRQVKSDIVKIDGGIVAMQFMLIARHHGYDTCPIGGFEHDKIGEAFGMDSNRYVPVMILAIGKGDYDFHQSVRLEADEVAVFQ